MPAADSLMLGALPIGLAHNMVLQRPVAAGQPVRWSDVAFDASKEAVRVRREMEDLFRAEMKLDVPRSQARKLTHTCARAPRGAGRPRHSKRPPKGDGGDMSHISDTTVVAPSSRADVYRKITWRIMPFIVICYLCAYLDRVNVGFAKLQMLSDLGFSDAVYGLGAGIFFIGYFIFEVPSNLILHRVGARRWIARIMITWAIVSALTLFVKTPFQFYTVRFFLGVAEAGFSPGIMLYLTYWFPAKKRGFAFGMYYIAIPLAGVVGGPLSGWILSSFMHSTVMAAWQWLFLHRSDSRAARRLRRAAR